MSKLQISRSQSPSTILSIKAQPQMPPMYPERVLTHVLGPCMHFPNSAYNKLPIIIMKKGFTPSGSPTEIEEIFRSNGWPPAWRYEMFPFSHYHSNVHESLGIFEGSALLQFGGDADTAPQERVEAGDVLVIPAGVAHKQIEATKGFTMVGAYPEGSPHWDCLEGRGGQTEMQQAETRIQNVALPLRDPIMGDDPGSVLRKYWKIDNRKTKS